jgi:hypothetical protein
MSRIRVLGLVSALGVLVGVGSVRAGEGEKSPKEQLAQSLATWQKLKAECKGGYSYAVRWSSFVGFGHETVIVAKDNKVVERRYREWSGVPPAPVPPVPGKAAQPEGESWTETGKDLGQHKKGAPVKTLDELYADAAKVLEKKLEPHERLYVQFDKAGLLNACFTVDTRIMDDAPMTGVVIQNIQLDKPQRAE